MEYHFCIKLYVLKIFELPLDRGKVDELLALKKDLSMSMTVTGV